MSTYRNEIGSIIVNGGDVKAIKAKFPWFPLEPTINVFLAMGYKESTAKKYLSLLEHQKMEQKLDLEKDFVMSACADINHLLVDASALGHARCIKLIKAAEEATFIYATLKEMDKPFSTDKDKFKKNINDMTYNILSAPNILLSEFGHDKDEYTDEQLIEYLCILPEKLRPTLITADKNVCAKAKAFGFDFLFFVFHKNEPNSNSFEKMLRHGIKLLKDNSKIYVEYDGPLYLKIIHNNLQIDYKNGSTALIHNGDAICVYEKLGNKLTKIDVITNIY